jgi:hypothetical protein
MDRGVLERRLAKLCGVWLGIGGGIAMDIPSGGNGGVKLDGREEVRLGYRRGQLPILELPPPVAEEIFNFNNRSPGGTY